MGISFAAARNGLPTCLRGARFLHSAYDPLAEAERFLSGLPLAAEPASPGEVIVLAGPCLAYLVERLRALRPAARLLAVQFSAEFRGRERRGADHTWYPDGRIRLADFLSSHIDDESMGALHLVEWPPAVAEFAAAAETLRSELRGLLDRLASSAATQKAYGRRWILNACRSFLLADELLAWEPEDCPVLVAGAGPSLEESIAALSPFREHLIVLSVSSSLAALRARGLEPDLAIATDGGYWSRLHLYPLAGLGVPLASPLSSLPSASLSVPLLLLDQGGFPETELCSLLGAGLRLPSHGTVAGSALALALRLSAGTVVVAGFDFAAPPSRSHARPHGFEPLSLPGERRLRPLESSIHERYRASHPRLVAGSAWSDSRALATYAAAIGSDALSADRPVHRLGASPVAIPALRTLCAGDLPGLLADQPAPRRRHHRRPLPSRSLRVDTLARTISAWRMRAGAALDSLERGDPADPDMVDLLRSVDLPDLAALRRAIRAGTASAGTGEVLRRKAALFLEDLEGRLLS